MASEAASSHARRNRLIALAASAITVVAIIFAFAADYLGIGAKWMRPAAELLLLAELVGLIVLERRQLFEPVHEKVSRMDTNLAQLIERLAASGSVTIHSSPVEVLRTVTRAMREAITRDHDTPQILRQAGLSGVGLFGERWQFETELQEFLAAASEFMVFPNSPANARGRRWSIQVITVYADNEDFERLWERISPVTTNNPLNPELKMVPRSRMQSILSPQTITDQDVVLALDDHTAVYHWGLHLQGRQYVTVFAQWFDELWMTLPGARLIISRNGINQKELDAFRADLAAATRAASI